MPRHVGASLAADGYRGFKLHASVNQQGLPLRAVVTLANCYDSPLLLSLVWDLKVAFLLADVSYYSKFNRKIAKTIGAKPVICQKPAKKANKPIKAALSTVCFLELSVMLHGSLMVILRYTC